MRRLAPCLLVVIGALWAFWAGSARAARPAHRYHLLSPSLTKRLSPGARSNVRATVSVGDATGTGVVLDRARGLVLTNNHVALEGPRTVRLASGKTVRVHEVVVSSQRLDYAILRTSPMPRDTRETSVDVSALTGRQRVYSVSAAAFVLSLKSVKSRLHERDPEKFLRKQSSRVSTAGEGRALVLGLAAQLIEHHENRDYPSIQRGEIGRKGRVKALEGDLDGKTIKVQTIVTNLPHSPAGSGSGVFDADNHGLVALHTAGVDHKSYEVPLSMIYADAVKRIKRTPASGAGRAAVTGWLGDVARP